MVRRDRLTPTLFDQLVADHKPAVTQDLAKSRGRRAPETSVRKDPVQSVDASSPFARYLMPKISTYNINDLRASIKRELDDLLNDTALESVIDLTPYPEVRTSVLNYGLPDIAGKTYSRSAQAQQQKDLTRVIRTFEPRLSKVQVEWELFSTDPGEITFTIRGEISDTTGDSPVRYKTKLEIDTAVFKIEG